MHSKLETRVTQLKTRVNATYSREALSRTMKYCAFSSVWFGNTCPMTRNCCSEHSWRTLMNISSAKTTGSSMVSGTT